MDRFFGRGRRLVGLDVGVSGIKAVELQGEDRPRLIAYNRVPLPADVIAADGDIKDRGAVIGALKTLFGSTPFSSKRVAVGAAGSALMTRKITVPQMSADELGHQLYWEAEQYLPFPLDDVNIDFAILGNSMATEADTPMMDVLLVAAKKEYIHNLNSIIEEAGLQPEVIDVQAFALGNVFEYNYGHISSGPGVVSVIVDIGAGSTKVSIVEGDKTVFTRELRQSGSDCTHLLSEKLQVSEEEAEKIKITDKGSEQVKDVISEFINLVGDELSKTLDFYISQGSDRVINGIYVCGGASKTKGLLESLEQTLPAPVMALNPIQHVAGSGQKMNANAIRELSYLGAVAIGLSLRKTGDKA